LILRSLRAPRRARLLAVIAVALLAIACSVDTRVDVTVREDGSGVVRVTVVADAEAVKAVESGGVPIDQAVRLSDLEAAGWKVGAWEKAEDGSATLVLSHPFETVGEVAPILSAASGDGGPLRRLRATRERTLFATEYGLRGTADLHHVKSGVPTDPELVESLGAQGVDVNVIDRQLLAQLTSSFSLEIVAHLPGQKPITVTAAPGKVTRINAEASVRNTQRILLLIAAGGFALLAIVLWRRGRRRRRRRGGERGRGGNGTNGTPAPRAPAPRPPAPRPPAPRPPTDPRVPSRAGGPPPPARRRPSTGPPPRAPRAPDGPRD
jgi:hypothetical protein